MKTPEKKLFFSLTFEFLEVYMKSQMMRSPATIESYRDALTVFRRYLRDHLKIRMNAFAFSDCTRDVVLGFMEFLTSSGSCPGTRNQRLAALKSYLNFAAEKDISLQSIALSIGRIPSCRDPKKERPILDEEAARLLLSAPGNSKTGIRDKTMMILLYDSAARVDEILSLRMEDVRLDSESPSIHVLGKGHKERVISLSAKTCDFLRQYISIYHTSAAPSTDFLFYTVIRGKAGKMSEANVERFIRKYARQVREVYPNIPDKVYPHMFRRTRATSLYRSGVDLSVVSRFLGHSQLETTRIYASPSVEMMREAMEKAGNPASREEPLWDADTDDTIARMCGLR